MTKKIVLTALSIGLALGIAAPARAEIVDYGYGSYGTSYGSTTYGSTTYGTGFAAITISRDLTIGSYGSDVIALESFLAARGFMAGQGSGYFGIATRDAVARFQASVGIYPASGYFGPVTRAYYNAQAGTYGQYPYGTGYGNCPSGTYPVYYGGQLGCATNYGGSSNSGKGGLDGGSATLRSFRVEAGDDTALEEGDDRAEVAEVSFSVRGGDIRLERADLRFSFAGNGNDADEEPWKVFDRVRLVADGDTVADMTTRSRSDWDEDGDGYRLRFDDLDDYVVREGDKAELVIEVDVANSVRGAGTNKVRWDIGVSDDGIRVTDADGDTQEIGDEDRTVRIEITD